MRCRKETMAKVFTIRAAGYGILCSLVSLLVLLTPFVLRASPGMGRIIDNGGYIVRDGTGLLKFREHDLFIPASTLKILTCLVALEKLGKDYRFETHFFVDQDNNLYIKGYGDPFLTSEAVSEIATTLAGQGIRRIGTLFLDESSFALGGERAAEEVSDNPYDAPNGALAVNFNALPVQVANKGAIGSGEPQTPLIPLMLEAGANLAPGRYRLNVDTLCQPGRLDPALRYTAELFTAFLQKAGIEVQNGYAGRSVPGNLQPVYIHKSLKSLEEIIRACLKNSNNYIANQLFLACGAKDYGLPAGWEKSRRSYAVFIDRTLHLGGNQVRIREGSGLSRQNKISPAALLSILELFRPYSALLKQKSNVLLKSGTMKDVYCYAGYFAKGESQIPFVILLNQARNNRDQVLQLLHAALGQPKTSQTHQ